MKENVPPSFLTRHSIKGSGPEEYPGLTKEGVDESRKQAPKILEMLENAESGTVLFLGGASRKDYAVRTQSTAKVYGDKMAEIIGEKKMNDVVVIKEEDVDKQMGLSEIAEKIKAEIDANPDKKFVVDLPLHIKEFSMSPWLDKSDKTGKTYSPYLNDLMERHNKDQLACVKEWLETKGKSDGFEGPDPTEIAKNHLRGIGRLEEFAKKFLPDRPVMVGGVGHSWSLDALASYLANNGEEANLEGFEKVGGTIIGDSEIAPIEVKDGKTVFKYHGKEFDLSETK